MKNIKDTLWEQKENVKKQFKEFIGTGIGKIIMLLGTTLVLSTAYNVGCSSRRNIDVVAKADFDRDGIEDVVGYIKPIDNDSNISALSIVNGRSVVTENGRLYVDTDKYKIIQNIAKFYDISRITNVSVEDVNGDGWRDVSYDMTVGAKKHKVYLNQGDSTGTLRGVQ